MYMARDHGNPEKKQYMHGVKFRKDFLGMDSWEVGRDCVGRAL